MYLATIPLSTAIILAALIRPKVAGEESAIDRILKVDNDENVIESLESSSVTKNLSKVLPAAYLQLLDDELEIAETTHSRPVSYEFRNQSYTALKHRLYFVWLPINITGHEDSSTTTVHFKQTFPISLYDGFSLGQIVLTLKDSASQENIPNNTFVEMTVSWIKRSSFSEELKVQFEKRQRISASQRFYLFNVTEFVQSQLSSSLAKENVFSVSFTTYSSRPGEKDQIPRNFETFFGKEEELPTLILFFTKDMPRQYNRFSPASRQPRSSRSRRRRSAAVLVNRSRSLLPRRTCHRQNLTVTAEDVGWETLVRPSEIDLGICVGACPFPLQDTQFNFTMHTFLVSRLWHRQAHNLANDIPKVASCVPVQYKSLITLEKVAINSDLLQTERVDDISVESCGCR